MARIPQNFIDDLLARTDIVPLVESRVPLKRQGSEYAACCPFHDEKSPSFTVSPNKQFYHCFGCGAHGNAVGFLMEYDRLEFRDAVEELARRAGVEIPAEAGEAGPQIDPRLWNALDTAQRLFTRALRDSPKAIDYLKGRGVDGRTAKAFGIGYAPEGWQTVTDAIAESDVAVAAGLAIRKDNGRAYDRFRDRVTFPIRDLRGRVIGFGGRAFGDDEQTPDASGLDAPQAGTRSERKGPKYLNSPETPVFHKGRQLYGLYEARQANSQIGELLVVEGYMDVVALAQFGLRNAVATLGTATTVDHLNLMFRSTSRVIFCFDGDRAGREAGWRAVERSLPAMRDGREIRLLFLPDGEDPDSLVRAEGPDAFAERAARAQPLSEFLLARLTEQADLATVDGRAKLVALARPHIDALSPGAFRRGLEQRISELAGLDITTLDGAAPPTAPRRQQPEPPPHPDDANGPLDLPPQVRRAARALLEQPALAADIQPLPHLADTPDQQLLEHLLHAFAADPGLTAARYLERLRDEPEEPTVQHLLAQPGFPPGIDLADELRDALARVQQANRRRRVDALLGASRIRELTAAEKDELRANRG